MGEIPPAKFQRKKRWVVVSGIILLLFVIFFTWSIKETNSQDNYIHHMMTQFLRNHKIEAQTINVTYNQLTQKRTISVVFKDEPQAVYYYYYSFEINEAIQQPRYGGSIKKHPEKGMYYKYDIVP
jgi:hypothetical protein